MANPVIHFEISGKDPQKLREYYNALFGWEADTNSPVAPEISEAGNYGFIKKLPTDDGSGTPGGIAGGIGGGKEFESHAVFYVAVKNVESALKKAESLGGTRIIDPVARPGGGVVVAQFKDPEGSLVGLVGPK